MLIAEANCLTVCGKYLPINAFISTLDLQSLTGSILNVKTLSSALVEVIDWHTLGIRLGVPMNMLKNIEQSYPMNNERRKNEMLSAWLQMSPFASWRDVAKALHEMEYHHAANTVHRKHESGWYLVMLVL